MAGLADRFGRVATDLRVSLTDRCNLRCTYCMPAEGLTWLPKPELLSDTEVTRLIQIAVRRLGVTEVRFTGGEPLLRPGVADLVRAVAAEGAEVSLTTNGVGLAQTAVALAEAGLRRINISLDTLRADRFATLTRRSKLEEVRAGLAAAADAGLAPIKLNSVLIRGVNDDEVTALADFALTHSYELRFIEQMPLDAGHQWRREEMITQAEILDHLSTRYRLDPDPQRPPGAPAQTWLVNGGPAKVGIIASVTAPFCAACDRTRLTADGLVRACLFSHEETNLRDALRAGATDEQLTNLWQAAMWGKPRGHGMDDLSTFVQPARPMSAIGG